MKIEDLKVGRVYRAKRPRVVHTLGGSYIRVRTMTKKERERQIKKAYIFYRRRVRTLLATGRYLLTIDYRKKDINNEK